MFDAVVLAGGAARRLGGAVKPEVRVGGVPLVDRALDAVAGARRVVLVAPPELAREGVHRTLEDPPLGGPVAGIAAGLAALDAVARRPGGSLARGPGDGSPGQTGPVGASAPDEVVVVLACDVPRAGAVVGALVAGASLPGVDGARLVDGAGRAQHLVAAYRRSALGAALTRLGEVRDASVRALVADLALADVPDPGGAADDVDTWDDVRRLDAELDDVGSTTAREGTRAGDRSPAGRGTIGPDSPTDRRTP